jgi:hypothetical protein
MNVHDQYSLSKAHRWLNCPGSVNRCKGIEDAPSSAAQRGTLIHSACEAIATGRPLPAELAAEDATLAQQLVEAGEFEAGKLIDLETAWDTVEAEIPTQILGMQKPGLGDRVWIADDMVVVLDYKTGLVQVEAEGNPQGAGYCVCAARNAGVTRAAFIIVQPALDGDGVICRTWIMEAEDLDLWETRLRAGRSLAVNSDSLVPGEHCRYCPARNVCEARTSALLVPRELSTWEQHWFSLDAAQRGDVLSRVKAAHQLAEEILKHAKADMLATGLAPKGFKLRKGAKREFWGDEQAAEAALMLAVEELGIPEDNVLTRKLKSPKDILKAGVIPQNYFGHLVAVTNNEPSLVEG